jgi:hypothetical protein
VGSTDAAEWADTAAASAGRASGYARDIATRELAYAVEALGKAVGALARELHS